MAEWPSRGQKSPNFWDDDLKAYIDEGDAVGGGGAVDSVNGETGVVVLSAADVDAASAAHSHSAADVGAAAAGHSHAAPAGLLPAGGTTGQIPSKASNADYDVDWVDPSEGGSGVQQGDRFRQGSRAINPYVGMFIQSYQDEPDNMVIWTQKTESDSTDVNIDGSVLVKHDKGYGATPGYADTFQVYSLAGSKGTIVGNNDFEELDAPPYDIPLSPTPRGFIRFELGPTWPNSEVARFNNDGDFIIGWQSVSSGRNFTQSGTTVTKVSGADVFGPESVGNYILWTALEGSGQIASGQADRIIAYISPTQVTVERERDFPSGVRALVAAPVVVTRADGVVEAYNGYTIQQRADQIGPLLQVKDVSGDVLFGVDSNGSLTGDFPVSGGGEGGTPVLNTYTPEITATGFSLGTTGAVKFGRYVDDGLYVSGEMFFRAGSSGFAAGSGLYKFSLPVAAHADDVTYNLRAGTAHFYDGTNTHHIPMSVLDANNLLGYAHASSSHNASNPVTPTAGDEWRIQFRYRKA